MGIFEFMYFVTSPIDGATDYNIFCKPNYSVYTEREAQRYGDKNIMTQK